VTSTPILIIGSPRDGEAMMVARHLKRRSIGVQWFDCRSFPTTASLSMRRTTAEHALAVAGERIDLGSLRACWLHRPAPARPSSSLLPSHLKYVQDESEHALANLWDSLPCAWFPGPRDAIRRANRKLHQLTVAERCGLIVPDWLMTNDPEEALCFLNEHDGRVVTKTFGASLTANIRSMVRYTERVSRAEILNLGSLPLCPVLFQAQVPKVREVRVTVVGDRVFSVALDSQASPRHNTDWRRFGANELSQRAHALPQDLEERCKDLLAAFSLGYGAFDFIVAPKGEYNFLEVNAGGRWAWLENATGLPIAAAVADHLATLVELDHA